MSFSDRRRFRASLASVPAVLFLLLAAPTRADFQPNVKPVLDVRKSPGAITVDGELNDPGWAGTAKAVNFSETWPGDNVKPEIGHEAWMTYTDTHLYFAFVIEDDPSAIRATLRDRDEVWRDDYVGLIMDTYGTGAWAYELFINPLGVQMDLRWTPNGEDFGFDVVFESEGKITDTGWQVEVGIPFQSMRFPDREQQEWRATFWHNQPRESRNRYSWAAGNRDDPCWPCNWGTIRGIEGVSGGGALELLPSITGFDVAGLEDPADPDSGFESIDSDAEIGLGLRYALSSSYAAEATINPDFSQVESDAAQIEANTTFALFFPERRPFFQEGSDLYNTWVNAVYTRSINNPDWASKLTGRDQRNSAAFLIAQDEDSPLVLPFEERSELLLRDRSWSTVGRVRRSLYDDSFVGALGTQRWLEGGGHGGVYGADTMLRFLDNYQVEAQLVFSHTEEPVVPEASGDLSGSFADGEFTEALDGESFWGHASYFSVERQGRRWSWDVDYWRTSPTFRADNGFVTQNDQHRVITWTNYRWEPDNDWFDAASAFFMVGRIWNFDGVRKDEWIRPEIDVNLKSQTELEFGWLTSNELFGGVELGGIQRWSLEASTQFSEWISGGVFFEKGDFVARRADPITLGDGRQFSASLNFKPWERLSIEPSFDLAKLEDPTTGEEFFDGYIVRTRVNLQFNRRFFLRLVMQYDDFNGRRDFEPLLTYRINPFTVFYVGSTHKFEHFGDDDGFFDTAVDQTERQVFAKLQYFFRR